jgi:hypothetical protein
MGVPNKQERLLQALKRLDAHGIPHDAIAKAINAGTDMSALAERWEARTKGRTIPKKGGYLLVMAGELRAERAPPVKRRGPPANPISTLNASPNEQPREAVQAGSAVNRTLEAVLAQMSRNVARDSERRRACNC